MKKIPIPWIEEQIKKRPGLYASAWKYLIDLYVDESKKKEEESSDEYVRLHKNQTAAQKFWRNE